MSLMLSDFEVLDVISTKGKKSTIKILKAKKIKTGELVCLKTFNSHKFSIVQEALKEAKVLMTASKLHNNICEMKDCFIEQIQEYYRFGIVMQHFAHGDLEDEIKRRKRANRPWSEEELKEAFNGMLEALNILQKKNICHRDLKPQNIFMEDETLFKIGDFGLSKKEEFGRLNSSKSLVGTPIYFSPLCAEAYLKHQLGGDLRVIHDMFKSDVFSLGLTFLRMASLSSIRGLNCSPQDTINDRISCLAYSQPIRSLIHCMLQVNENIRPDFIALPIISQELNSIMLSIQPDFILQEIYEIEEIAGNAYNEEKCLMETKKNRSEKKSLKLYDEQTLDSFGMFCEESIALIDLQELEIPEMQKSGSEEVFGTDLGGAKNGKRSSGMNCSGADRILEFLGEEPKLVITKDQSIYLS